MTTKVLERLRRPATREDPRYATLTDQEKEILALIAEGKTNRQIARSRYLAEKTVKNHVSSVLRKLHFERRTEAAVFAVEHAKSHLQSH
ncbi:response regulator transcription factor [Kribbella shirazensis]|uniref:DNA-binding NarL/FixJ family response regulator n=1 Tax=Kribbella shirazensis TaxID=1105143 RepID=A0A7X5VDC5_9ACTN|nr:DNA-binding NarL/FixJ family response regulator [Kribbella shirazensis]